MSNKTWRLYVSYIFTITGNHIAKRDLIAITVNGFIWIDVDLICHCGMTQDGRTWSRRMMKSIQLVSLYLTDKQCTSFLARPSGSSSMAFSYDSKDLFWQHSFVPNPPHWCLSLTLANQVVRYAVIQDHTFSSPIQFSDLASALLSWIHVPTAIELALNW